MNPLRRRSHPMLLEIATRPWLAGFSREAGRNIPLHEVPDEALDEISHAGFDAVWLMGMWTTGPKAKQLALGYPDLRATYDRLLPGWTEDDVAGSAYSIAAYDPPAAAGGRDGLRRLRERLHERGVGLVLDFVPNHMGIDHPWLDERPDLFVRGTAEDPGRAPLDWFVHTTPDGEERVFAHGRDPHFCGWSDTVQIDYRKRATREAMTELVADLATLADGLRCDVAMLVLEDVFRSTWGAGKVDEPGDFWSEAIPAVRANHPELALLAEVYWGMEDRMIGVGFDWAYDKDLLDRLCAGAPVPIRETVNRDAAHHACRCHFLENHDEERAWSVLGPERSVAAAVTAYTLPGLRFFQEGQAEGHRERPPVQMARTPDQPGDERARELYDALIRALRDPVLDNGVWSPVAFEDVEEDSADGLVGSCWRGGDRMVLAISNFADEAGRGHVRLPLAEEGPPVRIFDELT
ncbi:alpha-amylase, partial [bacterium]|nr:alpha-amylase [bacterium]